MVADRAKRQGGTEKADTGTGGGTTPVRTGGSADMGGQKPGSTTDTRRVEGGNEARGTQPADIPERSGELERAEVRIDATQEKTTYPTRSKSIAIGSVVPTNTAEPINSVLSKFEDIDAYVQDKLGYDTKDELYKALSAEQIDSVALGIQQIENGKAFIIGDMTGVGKGRSEERRVGKEC